MREELQCFSGHYQTNVLMVLHQLVWTQKREDSLETRDALSQIQMNMHTHEHAHGGRGMWKFDHTSVVAL